MTNSDLFKTDVVSESAVVPDYFIPGPSGWPLIGSVALCFFGFGATGLLNGMWIGPISFGISLAMLFYLMLGWFGAVAKESESGLYSNRVDLSFRWSMGWFIFSEVMLFAALFAVLFYARNVSVPSLADIDHRAFLWPDFRGGWPSSGPAHLVEAFSVMGAWPIPTINTALLLTSGATITAAHHCIRSGNRKQLSIWLAMTVLLGLSFVLLQTYEYFHAYQELNLKLSSGIFGATFFFLTGLHGLHVLIGSIILLVVLLRVMKGHFSRSNHFAFEAAAWYWHFVDIVWLGLYIIVYWL